MHKVETGTIIWRIILDVKLGIAYCYVILSIYYVVIYGGNKMPKPDIGRFSDPSFLILASLSSGSKHGYAMMEDIQIFSGILLEPGTLYGAISRLEERGFIRALESDERRRPYEITGAGEALFRDRVALFDKMSSEGKKRIEMRESAMQGGRFAWLPLQHGC